MKLRRRKLANGRYLSMDHVSPAAVQKVAVHASMLRLYMAACDRLAVARAADNQTAGQVKLLPLIEAATHDVGLSDMLPTNDWRIIELEAQGLKLHSDIDDVRERQLAACTTVLEKLMAHTTDDVLRASLSVATSAVITIGDDQ